MFIEINENISSFVVYLLSIRVAVWMYGLNTLQLLYIGTKSVREIVFGTAVIVLSKRFVSSRTLQGDLLLWGVSKGI